MAIEFKPAKRKSVPLLISLAGGTGAGKTLSAIKLATGLSDGKRFAFIDTENGRALHYADDWQFDHAELHAPFTPSAYLEALEAADKAGYPVIVVDSASHEWAGDGGILDMQEAELDRMAGNDWNKRDRVKMAAWIKPKGEHKRMVTRLLQLRAHVILCFRAEPKVEMTKENGRTVIAPKESLVGLDGWIPISEKSLPFEMTASFLLMADKPGYPRPIKLQEQHKAMFPLDRPIDETAGQRIAQWAAGDGIPKPLTSAIKDVSPAHPSPDSPPLQDEPPQDTVADQAAELIRNYGACNEPDVFAALEEDRAAIWKKCGAPTKAKLKEASAAAQRRVSA